MSGQQQLRLPSVEEAPAQRARQRGRVRALLRLVERDCDFGHGGPRAHGVGTGPERRQRRGGGKGLNADGAGEGDELTPPKGGTVARVSQAFGASETVPLFAKALIRKNSYSPSPPTVPNLLIFFGLRSLLFAMPFATRSRCSARALAISVRMCMVSR